MIVSKHSKKRMIERVDTVSSEAEAKRLAKVAFASGKNIAYFQNNPKFADYLRSRKQESNKCIIRVYKGYIYIWKGKHKTLVTVHEIPERFLEELKGKKSKS